MSSKQTKSIPTNTPATPSSKTPSRSHHPILTPFSTPSATPERTPNNPNPNLDVSALLNSSEMETARERDDNKAAEVELKAEDAPNGSADALNAESASNNTSQKKAKGKSKCDKDHKRKKDKKSKKTSKVESSSSESDLDDEAEVTTPSDTEDESTDSEEEKRQKKKNKLKLKLKAKRKLDKKKNKSKKHGKSRKVVVESSSSGSESDTEGSDSESEHDRRRHRLSRRSKPVEDVSTTEAESDADEDDADGEDDANAKLQLLQQQILQQSLARRRTARAAATDSSASTNAELLELMREIKGMLDKKTKRKSRKEKRRKKAKKASTLEYKRVDQLWDSTIHNYKLTESAEDKVDEFDEYIFTVRRKFDWENKYRNTVVDIKSKPLRDALAEVMKDVKGVSLVEDKPSIDPNMLFLYLEEIRTFTKKTLKSRLKKEKKRKLQRRIKTMISHCKVLIGYLDEDYDETKKRLYPMLEAGNITFDLLWALFKPNSIAFTSTYGSWEDPRCFKVDFANKESSFIKGEWYCIEGRYLEYDGKNFGLGDYETNIEHFQGPRKITSLPAYPLKYHKDPEGVTKQLIERGKKFVALAGMNYRFHKGLAFHKKKKTVLRFNINGRIMIDPAIFRRINPNYAISLIKPKDQDDLFSDDDSDDCCGCESDSDNWRRDAKMDDEEDALEVPQTKWKLVKDDKDQFHVVEVPVDEDGREIREEKLDKLHKGDSDASKSLDKVFSEEELLIASPVVLGFAFSEKAWLEFTLSGVREIEWNEGAFESLVIPEDRKSIVKALVSAHKFNASRTIDDVVQGKGKGLVFVLHGKPGVGKTLTAEGIAEFLKCPLYAISTGELGTQSNVLEAELQKIMDIAHSWGAVLLLDEADVFLEKREHQDVHRNALVSIFLRLLEYFQGILFLTTNRVDTFDDAFQSRIHLPLRYEDLSFKAKKEIWRMFLEKVRVMEAKVAEAGSTEAAKTADGSTETAVARTLPAFTDADLSTLARNSLNGRQIKNCVGTAQAIAVNEGTTLTMEHIRRVLDVTESFDRDLKGGTGYLDAMRSYT